jgi:type IV pilus assembly protein PilA
VIHPDYEVRGTDGPISGVMDARDEAYDDDERGFSLIELLVVVLVVAILMAIAIPTFLGGRQTAADRGTQANVRNAFSAARIYYNEQFRYSADPAEMLAVEPSLTWTTTPLDGASSERSVFVATFDSPSSAQTVVVVGRTKHGHCFYLKDVMGGATAGTFYDRKIPGSVACPVPDPDDPGWSDGWTST